MNNYNDEKQNKKYKRKHSKKKVTPVPVPMMMPMNPQPMLYQNPMIVQPQPMYPILHIQ